jgi:hypothetical protein
MRLIRRILIGTDCSRDAHRAVTTYAGVLAKAPGAHLGVLHVERNAPWPVLVTRNP